MRLTTVVISAGAALFVVSPISRVAAQEVEGVWRDQDGRFAEVEQDGETMKLRTASGLLFSGTVRNNRVRLTYSMSSVDRVPFRMPVQVKRQLVGGEIRLEGTADADGETLRLTLIAETVVWNPNTFAITDRQSSRHTFVYSKSHVAVHVVTYDEVPRPSGRSVSMLAVGDTFDLRLYVPVNWEGRSQRIQVTVEANGRTVEQTVPCRICNNVIDNLLYFMTYTVTTTDRVDPWNQEGRIRVLGLTVSAGDTVTVTYQGVSHKFRVWHLVGGEIRPMTSGHEFNFRLGGSRTVASDAFGSRVTGAFRVSGVPRNMGDPAQVGFINARLYSDTDRQGLRIRLEETGAATDRFWSRQAFTVTKQPTAGTNLRVTAGDRVYLAYGDNVQDIVWTAAGGNGPCYVAMSPAWRVPISRAQYDTMRDLLPERLSVDRLLMPQGVRAGRLRGIERILADPAYLTAEEVIVTKWSIIQRAAAAERVPPAMLGAVLLQNMRSMNSNDIYWDGRDFLRTWGGKSVGISQTPYYIVDNVARNFGITSLGIVKGTVLSEDRIFRLLFDADSSIFVAAAHMRMVADNGLSWARSNSTATVAFWDLTAVGASGNVTDAERNVVSLVGYNMDQWGAISGRPESTAPSWEASEYERGIVTAFEDIRRHSAANGSLAAALQNTPRVYVEAVHNAAPTLHQGVPRCYRGYNAGDIMSNVFPRDQGWSRRIPSSRLGRCPTCGQ